MFGEISIAIIDCAGLDDAVVMNLPLYQAVAASKACARCTTPLTTVIKLNSGTTVTKDELRAELERQAERYKDVYGGEVTTYAAQPDPERKPWRKRASVRDQAFSQELERMEKELRSDTP